MHELSVAAAIQREALLAAAKDLVRPKLLRIRIAVGEQAGVDPVLLRRAWQMLAPDVELELQHVAALLNCPNCGDSKEKPEEGWIRSCITCGTPLSVTGGDELELLQVEAMNYEGGAYAGQSAEFETESPGRE